MLTKNTVWEIKNEGSLVQASEVGEHTSNRLLTLPGPHACLHGRTPIVTSKSSSTLDKKGSGSWNVFFFFNECFIFDYLLNYLFLVALGLFVVQAFSGCNIGFLLWWLLVLQSMGSVVAAYGLNCSAACGIFPDQELNWCPCISWLILNYWTTKEIQP